MKENAPQIAEHESGFTLIEVLVSIFLFGLVGLTLTTSLSMGFKFRQLAKHRQVATQLATETMEQLASTDPSTLSSANNSTQTVTQNSIRFTRTTAITVNSDGSRTITVTVADTSAYLQSSVTLTNTYSLWGTS